MNTESKILIAIAAVVTVVASVLLVVGGGSDKQGDKTVDPERLVRADSIQTNPDAKVTLVEFGDLQCPACAAAQPVVQQVRKQFGSKVNFVWRHFPLGIHPNARPAANASEAARAEGKFFEFSDKLFATQGAWGEASSANAIQLFVQYGTGLGVSGPAIEKAVKDNQYKSRIDKDVTDGEALGVNSTPTFFLDGKKVETTELLAAVKDAVDRKK
ncbi:MAG: thioredoxin domain-containing protein [Patescibacteria group bacterium]